MDVILGIIFKDWLRLLKENRFAVNPRYSKLAFFVTFSSIVNSIQRRKELELFGDQIRSIKFETPIFVLGHWRSGTTLLHSLLTVDDQFAFPNLFQVSYPHSFIHREEYIKKYLENAAAQKRPMDNMNITYQSPGEDEFGIAIISLTSPIMAWVFPRHEDYYDRFMTCENVSAVELDRWKNAFIFFMKKLTLRYNKTLVLKSPTHTAKIKILLDMFPDARFIHIHRNPIKVFQSTIGLYETAVPLSYLQRTTKAEVIEGILKRYVLMYDAFFQDRKLIPEGQYYEVCYEDFVKDKIGFMKKIYDNLQISGFEKTKPKLESYLNSISNYEKNVYEPLSDAMHRKVTTAWHRTFEEWNYKF